MNEFTSILSRTGQSIHTSFDGAVAKTWLHKDQTLTTRFDLSGGSATVEFSGSEDRDLVLSALEALFAKSAELKMILIKNPAIFLLSYFSLENGVLTISRHEFFQLPLLWHGKNTLALTPERWTTTNEVFHPERPRVRAGQKLYSRFAPSIARTISFRVADPEKDLEIFHEWHNQERVFTFWELNKSKEELRDYLIKGLQDPHQFPAILEVDGTAVGYFEFYWVKEDRLGPYYDSEAFDRGFHFLIGDVSYLGFQNTDAILKSVCHFIFLDDPRTRKIMAEPRHDNVKILKYLETFKAWSKVKEFDFPHKRAALLQCRREDFFKENYL